MFWIASARRGGARGRSASSAGSSRACARSSEPERSAAVATPIDARRVEADFARLVRALAARRRVRRSQRAHPLCQSGCRERSSISIRSARSARTSSTRFPTSSSSGASTRRCAARPRSRRSRRERDAAPRTYGVSVYPLIGDDDSSGVVRLCRRSDRSSRVWSARAKSFLPTFRTSCARRFRRSS